MTKHTHIHTEADLEAALTALGKADPRFTALIAQAGPPPLRRRSTPPAPISALSLSTRQPSRERKQSRSITR